MKSPNRTFQVGFSQGQLMVRVYIHSFLKNLPAFWMRSSSGGFEGLWSSVTRAGSALQLKTPRESPQLEKMTYLGLINTEHTVVPDLSSPLATSGIFLETEKNHVKLSPYRK